MNEQDIKDLIGILNEVTIKGIQAERIIDLKAKLLAIPLAK
jgi:hypothetical protein